MQQNINLKELERKAWRSFFQDGLWDVYLGLMLMAMAVGALISDVGGSKGLQYMVYFILLALAMLGLWAGKRFVTVPRLGRVKFGPKGKARRKRVMTLLVFSVGVGAVLFVLTWLFTKGNFQGLPLRHIVPVVWIANALIVFGLGAYFLEFERLYLVGLMYALAVPLDEALTALLHLDLTFLAFGLPAAVILVTGLVVFVRFLRAYPLPREEHPPAERVVHGNR